MRALLSNPTFAVTTSAFETEILLRQIDVQAPKSQAVSMSFSLDAVWIDGTIVANNPINLIDKTGQEPISGALLGGWGGFIAGASEPNATWGSIAKTTALGATLGGLVGLIDQSNVFALTVANSASEALAEKLSGGCRSAGKIVAAGLVGGGSAFVGNSLNPEIGSAVTNVLDLLGTTAVSANVWGH